jgi:hypothetical protein
MRRKTLIITMSQTYFISHVITATMVEISVDDSAIWLDLMPLRAPPVYTDCILMKVIATIRDRSTNSGDHNGPIDRSDQGDQNDRDFNRSLFQVTENAIVPRSALFQCQ